MTTPVAPRVGVLRPDRALTIVAEIDARVIRTELERRIGPITLDLRIDGERLGSWRPIRHAAWPGDIDVRLDDSVLWSHEGARLAHLMARTIDADGAAVRAAMLGHLGIVPNEPYVVDDAWVARLEAAHVRPTDLWLIVSGADEVAVADPDIRALADQAPSDALDDEFDRIARELAAQPDTVLAERVGRLAAERDELRSRLADLDAQRRRDELDMHDRLTAAERDLALWRERAERAELVRDAETGTP